MTVDYSKIPSPCFLLEKEKLVKNLKLIQRVHREADVEIILAFKAFAMWSSFPIIREYIQSAAVSSLNEARLCVEEIHGKAHTYTVAYRDEEFDELLSLSSHLTFNSISQYEKYRNRTKGEVSCGLRVNPEWSDVTTDLYNPASSNSRLGITSDQMPEKLPEGVEGLHFHVLCESDSYALEKVLENFEERFGNHLNHLKWVNMGGGHLMTREDYNVDHLISILRRFKKKYDLDIILEPGSAFVWKTGDLIATVLDVVENGGTKTAILDVSFTCHMPDTLEMPYRPKIMGASESRLPDSYPYRLGGVSCLAGDFLECYYFYEPVKIGDCIVFSDMMHYTMVKTSMFNGVDHPSIGIWRDNQFELIREFDYTDFKGRLS